MEKRPEIEEQVMKALNCAKYVEGVEAPAFFTDRAMQRLRSSAPLRHQDSGSLRLLKIAAVIILAIVNLYTIYSLTGGSKQDIKAQGQATIKDFFNENQPSDSTEVTLENTINNE